jgi:uncharacterized protein
MQEYKLTIRLPNGNQTELFYRPATSELLDVATGKRVPIAHVGIDYDFKPGKKWPVAKTVSPETPLGKSHAIRALKIQMGLKCNAKCNYCNQTPRPIETLDTTREAKMFVEKLPTWLTPPENDGNGLRIELWGGEPFLYWETMKYLAESLHARYPKAVFNVVTNGTLLDDEKIDWLDKFDFSVAVSHDGPGHKQNRGMDPFDNQKMAENIRKLYARLHPKKLISFNCVLAKENISLTAVHNYIADKLGCTPEEVLLSTEETAIPHEEIGQKLIPHSPEEHTLLLQTLFRDMTEGGAIKILNVKDKLEDFFRSIAQGRPAETLGLRCGLDRDDTIAVDLAGNVLTCQNGAATCGHKIGSIDDFDNIKLNTAWHWSKREECPNCPVVQICKGGCMRLKSGLWRQSCDTTFTYNLAVLATAMHLLTNGGVLTEVEGTVMRRPGIPGVAQVVEPGWGG